MNVPRASAGSRSTERTTWLRISGMFTARPFDSYLELVLPKVSIGVMAGAMVYGYRKVTLVSQFLSQYKSLHLF